jgi:hypothetical protein
MELLEFDQHFQVHPGGGERQPLQAELDRPTKTYAPECPISEPYQIKVPISQGYSSGYGKLGWQYPPSSEIIEEVSGFVEPAPGPGQAVENSEAWESEHHKTRDDLTPKGCGVIMTT